MWSVTIVPAGDRGVHVEVTNGEINSHVAWVSYRRWRSTQPFLPFEAALRRAIRRAESEAEKENGGR